MAPGVSPPLLAPLPRTPAFDWSDDQLSPSFSSSVTFDGFLSPKLSPKEPRFDSKSAWTRLDEESSCMKVVRRLEDQQNQCSADVLVLKSQIEALEKRLSVLPPACSCNAPRGLARVV
mmetsp:Transcript_118383/g.377350  ORF Transcript_118383/g.377350 Transcript_118383/m.377350 type:complete len:118 (-) Transcript_118383:303-656(-)